MNRQSKENIFSADFRINRNIQHNYGSAGIRLIKDTLFFGITIGGLNEGTA